MTTESFRDALKDVIECELLECEDVKTNRKGLLVTTDDGTVFQVSIECLSEEEGEVGNDGDEDDEWGDG